MTPSLTVHHQSGSYPIFIGGDLLQRSNQVLADWLDPHSLHAVITDDTVDRLYTQDWLRKWGSAIHAIAVPVGEASKSLDCFAGVMDELLRAGLDRQSTVIALGGGVPGDLAGFAAATFMRGVNFLQIPTTLLAQVDSSVGGKTGLNLKGCKNSVGVFWQPQAVLIDPAVLSTLEHREFTSGLAEVVKYGVILDPEFFHFLECQTPAIRARDPAILQAMIQRCCELKAQVVQADERETRGQRAILNYGHTFGHAIESVFGYGCIPHGHAVAMGMHAAAKLAQTLGRVDAAFVTRQKDLLDALEIPTTFPQERHAELIMAMRHDKKSQAGETRFILPGGLGTVELVSGVENSLVHQAMEEAAGNC